MPAGYQLHRGEGLIDNEGWTLSEIYDALQAGADLDAPEDDEALAGGTTPDTDVK